MTAPRPGYRWVRGVYTTIRSATDGYERTVAYCCMLCFTRRHQPENCDRPEWFEVKEGIVA